MPTMDRKSLPWNDLLFFKKYAISRIGQRAYPNNCSREPLRKRYETRLDSAVMLYYCGSTYQEIGTAIGVSKERVRQIIWKFVRTVDTMKRHDAALRKAHMPGLTQRDGNN